MVERRRREIVGIRPASKLSETPYLTPSYYQLPMNKRQPNVKRAEGGNGAERRSGAATSEVRNAQWDMLRREAHGGIIQRDGLTDGHTGTEVPR